MNAKKVFLSLVLLCGLPALMSCSEHSQRTVTSETVTSPIGSEQTTITTQTRSENIRSDEHQGMLSDTFEVIGDIIAYPFKLIGSLLEAIF